MKCDAWPTRPVRHHCLDLVDPASPREVARRKDMFVGEVAAVEGRLLAAQPTRLEWLDLAGFGGRPWVTDGPALPWGRMDWVGTSDVVPAPAANVSTPAMMSMVAHKTPSARASHWPLSSAAPPAACRVATPSWQRYGARAGSM